MTDLSFLPVDSTQTRQKVIDACLFLLNKGLVIATWGNISIRLADGNILITPSRIPYEEMKPEDLVVLAPDGTVVKGFRISTSERELHRGILNARPDVHAVIHTHSTYAMACCAMEGGIPAFSEEMAQLLGGAIPLSKAFVPSEQHENLGKMAVESIGNANALLLRNHGPVCLGRSLDEALACAQIVEKTAEIYMHIRAAGEPCLLEERWVKAGRTYFTDAYGKT